MSKSSLDMKNVALYSGLKHLCILSKFLFHLRRDDAKSMLH